MPPKDGRPSRRCGQSLSIAECTYHYNLAVSTFGPGVYRVDIVVDGVVVGSATFALR